MFVSISNGISFIWFVYLCPWDWMIGRDFSSSCEDMSSKQCWKAVDHSCTFTSLIIFVRSTLNLFLHSSFCPIFFSDEKFSSLNKTIYTCSRQHPSVDWDEIQWQTLAWTLTRASLHPQLSTTYSVKVVTDERGREIMFFDNCWFPRRTPNRKRTKKNSDNEGIASDLRVLEKRRTGKRSC